MPSDARKRRELAYPSPPVSGLLPPPPLVTRIPRAPDPSAALTPRNCHQDTTSGCCVASQDLAGRASRVRVKSNTTLVDGLATEYELQLSALQGNCLVLLGHN